MVLPHSSSSHREPSPGRRVQPCKPWALPRHTAHPRGAGQPLSLPRCCRGAPGCQGTSAPAPASPEPLSPARAGGGTVRSGTRARSAPVLLPPRPPPPRSCRERTGAGTAPWLLRAGFGGSLQHLRSGEPQGRPTDRLAGFWGGRGSVRPGVSEPCPWARPEPRSVAVVAAPPRPEPRGGTAAAPPGQGAAPSPRPGRAERTGRGRSGKAARPEGCVCVCVCVYDDRGFWGGEMLYPPAADTHRSGWKAGSPGRVVSGRSAKPPAAGGAPPGSPVLGREGGGSPFSLSLQETAPHRAPKPSVNGPSQICDERRDQSRYGGLATRESSREGGTLRW